MTKRVIVLVLVLLLALFVYVGYHSYDSKRVGKDGEVYSNGSLRRGEQQAEKASDADTIVYPNPNSAAAGTPASGTTTAQPQYQGQSPPTPPINEKNAAGQVTQGLEPAATNAPASDTISPNPPNGMVFSGTGLCQLYRQGNITWRLDTDTGRACVIFATDEEWKKPRVYRAGCGKG